MGYLSKYDRITGQHQDVSVYPVGPLGAGAVEMKYRFQWTYPIVFSPHDPNTVYVTSQYVHRSTDEGMSWEIISPVLTHAKSRESTLQTLEQASRSAGLDGYPRQVLFSSRCYKETGALIVAPKEAA